MPGDFPDPSVIRVGNDYWATATTSQWAPIFPLLHSTDLVNWETTGAVFQTPPSWSAGSYWAPEISQDNGRFFVYYTARKKDGPLCVAVADSVRPQGPYTDHGPLVCQDAGSIDAAPVRDENGRRYLVWKEDGNSRKLPTPLWAQPLSDEGLKLIGEKRELLRNQATWEANLVEGPYILRRDGWFYMFYSADACCGRRCNYKLGVARARQLLGPWEREPDNPILAGNDQWKCPGHGTVVQDPAGRTFLLYHAYHASTFEFVGRQGLLDQITWNADGWPAINGGKGPSGSAPSPSAVTQRRGSGLIEDGFDKPPLNPGWQWPWDQASAPVIETGRGGWLRLATGTSSSAVAARQARSASYSATTVIDVASLARGARAGLAAFGNRDNLLAVTVERGDRTASGTPLTVVVSQTQKGERRVLATTQLPATALLHLRLTARDRTQFDFAVSPDGRTWKSVGGGEGGYLPPWDLAVRVALFVSGQSSARFGLFRLEPA
jgi:beta-xylosidase